MSTEINYDRIRNAGDHVMPHSFRQYDQDGIPTDTVSLSALSPGQKVEDAAGNRFRLLAHGPMQSAVVLRDRYRAMFYADCGIRVKAVRG